MLDNQTLGFADYRGNRQYITLANLTENDHAFLFLLDSARRQRIKLWGRRAWSKTTRRWLSGYSTKATERAPSAPYCSRSRLGM